MVSCEFAADDTEEPLIKTFGEEVQAHLGFKVLWGKDSKDWPAIQRVDLDSAADKCGICPGDMMVAINGVATMGRAREELLPLLRLRPLQLELVRRGAGTASNGKLKKEALEDSKIEHMQALPDTSADELALMNTYQSTGYGRSPSRAWLSEADIAEAEDIDARSMGVRAFMRSASFETDSEGLLEGEVEDSDTCAGKAKRRCIKLAGWLESIQEPPRSGSCYRVSESRAMFVCSSLVIISHAVCVTILSDWELQHVGVTAPFVFDLLEMAFLCFYVLELILRLYVHGLYFFVNEHCAWNVFDLSLVALSGFDVALFILNVTSANDSGGNVSFMRIFRLFKIAKILRTLRVIKVFRELHLMLQSFARCFVSLFWGMALMLFLLFIFALVFAQGVATFLSSAELPEDELLNITQIFGSVATSMLSLYMAVTGGNDWTVYYGVIRRTGAFYEIVFLLYTFFFGFALFNIMTGVFLERAIQAAVPDRDEMIHQEQKKLQEQVEEFRSLCTRLDTRKSGTISQEEFREHMKNPMMVSYMSHVGLVLHDVEHFFHVIAGNDAKEVDIDRFVEGCMAMKGNATALDVHKQIAASGKILDRLDHVLQRMLPEEGCMPCRLNDHDGEHRLTCQSQHVQGGKIK
eukprot:TRINITY_DN10569_c0_g1_i1.p1 TRINITY_DN10569_c0_g1~~TRINITY_DN10569_c0_g1_i1.p1  ORF type:complete len:707 (+),score=113.34 TRINITY_DN10569_c0_g1_i1:217-2121(+)